MSLDPRLRQGASPALPGIDGCALAIIDMQNCYCSPKGFFASKATDSESCARVVAPCAEVLAAARAASVPVIHVIKVSFSERIPTIGFHNGRRTEGLMLPGEWDAAITEPLRPLPGEPVVEKLAYSAFQGTAFDAMLQRMGIRQLAVIGVTTSICVESTVRDAAQRGLDVYVARDASAEWEIPRHERSIEQMGYAFARIVTARQLVDAWKK
jgi:ureidoacrylate peracid hydrolase